MVSDVNNLLHPYNMEGRFHAGHCDDVAADISRADLTVGGLHATGSATVGCLDETTVRQCRLTSGRPWVENTWFQPVESTSLSKFWFHMSTCTPTPRTGFMWVGR